MNEVLQKIFVKMGLVTAEPTEDDLLWKEWLEITGRPREPRDLKEVLSSSLRDAFKQRALTILLSPNLQALPKALWQSDKKPGDNYLSLQFVDPSTLSKNLCEFAAEVIITHMDVLLIQRKISRESAVLLDRYNWLALRLLEVLPEDHALGVALFTRFSLRDYVLFATMLDDASGYRPFESLMMSKKIPEKWKRIADEQMRKRVIDELMHLQVPRESWEKAPSQYTYAISLCLTIEEFPYSADLLETQLEFLLANKQHAEQFDFLAWRLKQIMQLLADEKYRDLRLRYVSFLVLEEQEGVLRGFRIGTWSDLALAEQLLVEFGGESSALASALQDMISQARPRLESEKSKKTSKGDRLNDLLARMS